MFDELLHFASSHVRKVEDVTPGMASNGKPLGFWVSAGAAWAEWCAIESFGDIGRSVVTRVHLAPSANILRIETVGELDNFHAEYARDRYEGRFAYPSYCPDWKLVGERYDGIIIAPYQWERRLDTTVSNWYYGWDVASGCLWRSRAIASLEPLDVDPMSLLESEEARDATR